MSPGASREPVAVKICGLTRPEDARAAVAAGASYLGVILAGGPRQVTMDQASAVVRAAGDTPVFGVFGSQGCDEILEVARRAGLRGAQLHGGADLEAVGRLREADLLVLAVARLATAGDLSQLDTALALGGAVLVEPRVAGRLGGSGTALPAALAAEARARIPRRRMFLAGGLTPESVADAIRSVRPDAVDVSSGVEEIPGIKDHHRMARFLEVVRWS
jgi:phosphoribosylanthranilate isomerase